MAAAPVASAPRLYVDSLNETFDDQSARLSALSNRVPGAVLGLEGRGGGGARRSPCTSRSSAAGSRRCFAAALVSLLLLITFDLDRPTRGLIKVPATPLVAVRASMELPPAASGPEPALDVLILGDGRGARDQDEAELREIVGLPSDLVVSKIADRLNDLTRSSWSSRRSCAWRPRAGTAASTSRRGATRRVRAHPTSTLLLPDRPGKRIADTLTNLLSDPRIALLFPIPASATRSA
jgi:hypothetical protein